MRETIVRLIVTLIILAVAVIVLSSIYDYARADDYYVLCRPESEVNIREKPKLKSRIVACASFGDRLTADMEKNGFVHVTGLAAEEDSGWIYKGLLVEDRPVASKGMAQVMKADPVMCRKYADTRSKVVKKYKAGENVKVLAISEEWCVTEKGYIKTEFLTLNAPVKGAAP